MLLITCPYCGPRPELEFKHGGEAHLTRDPSTVADADWGAFLFARANTRGIIAERWRHTSGCGRFFNCLRDTVSDQIVTTYRIGVPRPDVAPAALPPNLGDVAPDPSVAATEAAR